VTEAGFGMLQQMSVRENPRPRLLLFDLPTLRVCLLPFSSLHKLTLLPDANLFKEAFIKAQQENELLFAQSS
jgi:hypothetical protein